MLACSTNTYNPLKSVFPYLSQVGLSPHHTRVHLLVPAGTPETWLRMLAPYGERWPCQGSPEMASEAGTLSPFTAGSLGNFSENPITLYSPSLHITSFGAAFTLGYNLSGYLNWVKQVIFDTASH